MTTEQSGEEPSNTSEEPSRFEVELEFVQSLANPQYVNFLAQNNYFNNEDFLRYLEYLEYFRKPEYAKFIIYPNCLAVLTLLKNQQFRNDIQRGDVAKALMDEMFYKWAVCSTS